jgi:hypothetical protein
MLHEKHHTPARKVSRDTKKMAEATAANEAAIVRLPKPKLDSETSLEQALKARRTVREIGDRALDPQVLSDLLFAACGVNRRHGPFGAFGLTAASASNSQEIEMYVALASGAYLFNHVGHELLPISPDDVRPLTVGPRQPAPAQLAPVQLIFVADLDKLEHTAGYEEPGLHDPEVQKSYYFVDTGLIAANVYLFAAAAGLACWFHNCDRNALSRALGLRPNQRVLFAQAVGYPAHPRRHSGG